VSSTTFSPVTSPPISNQIKEKFIKEGDRVAVWFEGDCTWYLGSVREDQSWDEDLYLVKFDDNEEIEIVLSTATHTFNLSEKDRWIFEFEVAKLPSLLHVHGNIPEMIKHPKKIKKINHDSPLVRKYRNAPLSPIIHKKERGQIWAAFSGNKFHYIELEDRRYKRGEGEVWGVAWLEMFKRGKFKEVGFSMLVLPDETWRFVSRNKEDLIQALKK